jgi:rubrerythrin
MTGLKKTFKKDIADEVDDRMAYARQARKAASIGDKVAARVLLTIAKDEAEHKKKLEKLARRKK